MNNEPKNQCAIFVSSCDAFGDAWEPFFKLFFKYWPDCTFPVYLLTTKKIYPDERVVSIPIDPDRQWASNLKTALRKHPHPNIIYLQEDYFLRRDVQTEKIYKLLEIGEKENAAYIRLAPIPAADERFKDYAEVGLISQNAPYRSSLQAAIWNTDILLSLLQEGETGWDMELRGGHERSKKIVEPFLCAKKPVLDYYCTGIVKGKWEYGAVKFLRKEGFDINFNIRGIEKYKTYLKRKLRSLAVLGEIFAAIFRVTEAIKRRM